ACPGRPARTAAARGRGGRYPVRRWPAGTGAAARARNRPCSCLHLLRIQPGADGGGNLPADRLRRLRGVDHGKALRFGGGALAEAAAHTLEEIVLLALDPVRPE